MREMLYEAAGSAQSGLTPQELPCWQQRQALGESREASSSSEACVLAMQKNWRAGRRPRQLLQPLCASVAVYGLVDAATKRVKSRPGCTKQVDHLWFQKSRKDR
jgi:hypothetical protein